MGLLANPNTLRGIKEAILAMNSELYYKKWMLQRTDYSEKVPIDSTLGLKQLTHL